MEIAVDNLWSIEAEAAVIGSMIIDPSVIPDMLTILEPESFFKSENQLIFEQIYGLFLADSGIDAVTLRGDLSKIGLLQKVGGVEYLGEILNSVPSSANAIYYATIVRERKRYRDLIAAVQKMTQVVEEPQAVDAQVEKVQDLALQLEQGKLSDRTFSFADTIEAVSKDKDESVYIPTGLRGIDNIIGGVGRGESVVLAARPAMGKSALALQWAVAMAQNGLSVLYFSLEMSAKSLMLRALKSHEVEDLKNIDVTVHEAGDTPDKIVAFVKKRKQTHAVDIVFVDYLQLMTNGRRTENRVQDISAISRKLKLLAMRENIPIVILSQLNRQVENRDKHRPRVSDLRESGAIEQDADLVLLIHRNDVYRRQEDPNAPQDGSCEVVVGKNRRGTTGIAQLIFLDEKVKFGDRATYEALGILEKEQK